MTARDTTLKLLMRWSQSRALADELLEEELAQSSLAGPDRALVTELFYGCLRRKGLLDYLVEQHVPRPPRLVVAWILRLGLYQLAFTSRIPPHAAVHESVELAKHHATATEARFVNAVLRRAQDVVIGISTSLDLAAREPWTMHSHPRWLWNRWVQRWGAADTARLCEWNNQPPPLYVRVNTLKAGAVDAAEAGRLVGSGSRDARPPARQPLEGERPPAVRGSPDPARTADRRSQDSSRAGRPSVSISCGVGDPRTAEPVPFHPLCYRVDDPAGLFESAAWKNGELYAQDPSTLLAVDLLDPQPGESILDMCAAPGGKTTYLAQKMSNRGTIIAADASNHRLARVTENCRRLGVTIVATLACEGTRLDRCWRGPLFDRVLVDAPCSNTGVMRRRPDLRWRLAEPEIARLAELQQRLLAKAGELVRPGGCVVYSTCSLEAEENEQVVQKFLANTPGFACESTRQLFPPRDQVDGAFVARLRRG